MIHMNRFLPRIALALALPISLSASLLLADEAAPDAPDASATPAPKAPGKKKPAKPPADAAAPEATATPATAPDAGAGGDATTAPATQPEAVEIPQNQSLREDVEDYWHWGKIARYSLSAAMGKKINDRAETPLEKLRAFEAVAAGKQDSLDQWMLRWESLEAAKGSPEMAMRDISNTLMQLLDKGRYERRQDKDYIKENIAHLADNERAYLNHLARLRDSGELAVPYMLDALQDQAQAGVHDAVRRALIDMGRSVLSPLLAATEMKNETTLITVIGVLEQIGYDTSVPYLARIAQDKSRSSTVQAAATNALRAMGASTQNMDVADLFYKLGERFYYNTASLQADSRTPNAWIWSWEGDSLSAKKIPGSIFGDRMAMREARTALELGSGRGDALSLWLAADNKREVDLGDGTDDSGPKLPANYFNVTAGAQYVDAVLSRSLGDKNAAVALKAIKSLEQIVGPGSLSQSGNPLVDALGYPDRLVRFEAAFALGGAMPAKPFAGQESVVPLLAEAVSQTGTPNVLIAAPTEQQRAKITADLKNYGTAGGTSGQAAINDSATLPFVDVILVAEDLGAVEIDKLFNAAAQAPRLQRAARLVITRTKASQWAERAINDPLLFTTQAIDSATLSAAIEEARKKVGGLPIDEKLATTYALRATDLLQKLAINHAQVYDLSAAEPTLLASLNDKRPEIAKAVGNVLALLDAKEVQPALLSRANDDKAPEEVRISLYKSMAMSAKFFGNRLSEDEVASLQKVVDGSGSNEVRTAAAEARGALDLPADLAKQLVIQQKG